MSGTSEGARKGADTRRRKYGDDHYAKMGAKGGENSNKGGFASKKKGKDGLTGPQRASKLAKEQRENEKTTKELS